MKTLDFDKIVPDAVAGDKAARDKLMENFYAWSITQAKSVLSNAEEAKDVALGFWEWAYTGGLAEYDPKRGSFYTWMRMQIRFRALEAARKSKPKILYSGLAQDYAPEDMGPSADPADQLAARQDLESVAAKLRSPMQKDVFWRMIEGANAQDIAEELGVSPKRISNVIGEVRALIRATIGE